VKFKYILLFGSDSILGVTLESKLNSNIKILIIYNSKEGNVLMIMFYKSERELLLT
jgi:hypothetical protein